MLGNVAIDRVDGGPPRAGGCPTFAAPTVAAAGGSLVTRCAPDDRLMFEDAFGGCRVAILDAAETAAFEIANAGDRRQLTVRQAGERWRPSDLDDLELEQWVHAAPLLEGDVDADVLRAIADRGCRISFDGQGLIRRRATGPLRLGPPGDRGLLRLVDVLKLSQEEAQVLGCEAAELGVEEVIVTRGSQGATVYAGGRVEDIRPSRIVEGAEPTGAGDAFVAGYVTARAAGVDPAEAAAFAAELVVELLAERAT